MHAIRQHEFGPPDSLIYETQALAEAAGGRIVPPLTTFPLADAAHVHAALEARQTIGKTVLVP